MLLQRKRAVCGLVVMVGSFGDSPRSSSGERVQVMAGGMSILSEACGWVL